jgi:hypothetical protein
MRHAVWLIAIALLWSCGQQAPSKPALSGEPVQVWTPPPSIANAKEIGEQMTAASKVGLQAAKDRWIALHVNEVSYVLDQFTTGILVTDCDMEPIAVRVVKSKVVSARYATGTPKCPKGTEAKEPQYSQKILTPNEIFEEATNSIAENPHCGITVRYDEPTGLPSLIKGGCWWFIPDTYWAIEVREIRIYK